jgi:hypothetical protein
MFYYDKSFILTADYTQPTRILRLSLKETIHYSKKNYHQSIVISTYYFMLCLNYRLSKFQLGYRACPTYMDLYIRYPHKLNQQPHNKINAPYWYQENCYFTGMLSNQ